ncbi:hypothetical protein [Virgibacillus salexigens]|uniref:hypothetical protein n=1 Tax=Virgibacillus salexigens TaxID=61016 RepID=UPI00190CDD1B|nr:hypothetical protein [Virgibacillus salexigens]
MCKTCNGTGGLAIDNGYFLEFRPCPDSHCDFVRDDSDLERLKARLEQSMRESA